MSEKDKVYQGKVKQSGIFSFKDLYAFLYSWLKEEGYDIVEKSYSEKISGDSKQIEITWEAAKEVSDYFKFQIKVEWQILGMKSVDVQKEDKKIKMDSGSLEVKFKGVLLKDYEDRWENQPFWKFMRGIYDRYVIKSRIDEYQIKLIEEVEDMVSQCKSFLAIEARH
ncbi:hypothetical protein J4218_02970 [Candidatus Pacearchaeota archaeon]|nr:hypothetical protein [Candidatus Pacearchaeota archaeon]